MSIVFDLFFALLLSHSRLSHSLCGPFCLSLSHSLTRHSKCRTKPGTGLFDTAPPPNILSHSSDARVLVFGRRYCHVCCAISTWTRSRPKTDPFPLTPHSLTRSFPLCHPTPSLFVSWKTFTSRTRGKSVTLFSFHRLLSFISSHPPFHAPLHQRTKSKVPFLWSSYTHLTHRLYLPF